MPNEANQKYLQAEYRARINRVIDYVQGQLDQELSLETLAGVANFSEFHFHRIFGVMTGETLNQFIQRLRVEKAAHQLIYNPKKSITEIALDCGFSGSATFARAFKEMYQMSASQWRAGGQRQYQRKIRKTEGKKHQTAGKNWQDVDVSSMYIDPVTHNLAWRIKMTDKTQVQVEVKEMPDRCVAYIRHIGPYKGDHQLFAGLFDKLMKWAGPRGLLQNPETQVLAIYHDDPEITTEDRLRVEVCVTISEDTPVEGEIGKMRLAGGKYAVARFELSAKDYEAAWQMLYGEWLPQSGFQPDDRPAYEHFLDEHTVDICVPVKPL